MPTKDTSVYAYRGYVAYQSDGIDVAGNKFAFFRKVEKLLRQRTGESVPNWKQKIQSHVNATSNMNGTYVTLKRYPGFAEINYQALQNDGITRLPRTTWFRGDLNFGNFDGPSSGAWTTDAERQARIKLYQKIHDARISLAGGTFVGELGETLRMMKRPAQNLRNQLSRYMDSVAKDAARHNISNARRNAARHSKRKWKEYRDDLKRFVNDVSGSWLENAFGWQPLFADIEDARKGLDELLELPRVKRVSAGGQARILGDVSVQPNVLFINNTHLRGSVSTRDTSYATYRYRGGVKAQAQTTWQGRAERFGFTFSEFIPTAWELLPWSFLIDYFANVGDCLSAAFTDTSDLYFLSGTSILGRQIHKWNYVDRDAVSSAIGGKKYLNSFRSSSANLNFHYRVVVRTATISGLYPFGLFTLKIPSFDSGARKWLNIAALLGQASALHPQDMSRIHHRNWSRG